MINPRTGIPIIQDAYALAVGAPEASVQADDIIYGTDWDGVERVYGVVRGGQVGIRGTVMPDHSPIEWIEDAAILPVRTPLGAIAAGVWGIYGTFWLKSGATIASLAGKPVHGHSLGAGLAAVFAVEQSSPYSLWACPRWFSGDFVTRMVSLGGWIFQEAGDMVPHLPPLGYADLPGVTYLTPLGSGDLAYHHELSTYAASYNAQFPAAA